MLNVGKIEEGFVLDHIKAGKSMDIYYQLGLDKLDCTVAIAMLSVESIIDAWWKLSSIFSGGMLGLFLLGCIPQRINRLAAIIGCLCGVAVIAWISLAGLWDLPGLHLHEYLAIVLGTSTIFLIGFLATVAFTRSKS